MLKKQLKKVGAKALEAAADKVGSHVGEFDVNKVISAVNNHPKSLIESHHSINPKEVQTIIYKEAESDDEESTKPMILNESNYSFKPMGNIIMRELNKKSDKLTSPKNLNAVLKNNIMVMVPQINNLKVN